MKTMILNRMLLFILLMVTGYACKDKCSVEHMYNYYEPVYVTTAELRASVKVLTPQPLADLGKIYRYGSWLFVNEVSKGIHVIDNSIPSKPIVKSFINIPGNYDLSIKDNMLYADSYIDLLAIDISDLQNIKVVKRLEGIFSAYNSLGYYPDPQKGIITSWVLVDKVSIDDSNCNVSAIQPWGGVFYNDGIAFASTSNNSPQSAIAQSTSTGLGGSMSRFAIDKEHLYLLDNGNLKSIDIKVQADPIVKSSLSVSWDVQTIFPYNGNLFLGSQSGLYIISVADPENPKQVSLFAHVRRCDPVVVQGDLAYVTLRSASACQGNSNELDIISIKDLSNPTLLKTYSMTSPQGLGIDNQNLFICDGDDGLKIYNAQDYSTIDRNQLSHYQNINAYDVIPYQNIAIMIGNDGIYQYDYTDTKNIKLLSVLSVTSKQQ